VDRHELRREKKAEGSQCLNQLTHSILSTCFPRVLKPTHFEESIFSLWGGLLLHLSSGSTAAATTVVQTQGDTMTAKKQNK
jgi:hypothetical protein